MFRFNLRPTARVVRHLGVLLLALAMLAPQAAAQTETGQITGKVSDPHGAVVPNAGVTITSVETGRALSAASDAEGVYTFTNLQPGLYEVAVEGQGFAPSKQRVQVTVGAKTSVETVLSVTAMTGEAVEVIAGSGVEVNTVNQELSDVVTGEQIRELPTVTRNPYDLVQLSGNAASDDPSTSANEASGTATYRGTGVSINGMRASSTNILLDGTDNNDAFTANIGQNIPLDAIGEFRVITSNFSAEYGRAAGGIVNVVTRSGGNSFNGSLYEFNRISKLASNGFDNNARGLERGVFTRNQFGYAVGGPIVKKKLFFFNSTEWIRVRSSGPATAVVATPQLIAASAPATRAFFNAYQVSAVPTGRVVTVGQVLAESGGFPGGNAFAALPADLPAFQEVSFNLPQNLGGGTPQDAAQMVARVDWNYSDRTQFYGRYAVEKREVVEGGYTFSPYQGFNTGISYFNQNAALSLTHTFSPVFVSNTKLAFSRVRNDQPLGEQPPGPTLYVSAAAGAVGGNLIAFPGYLPFNPGIALPTGGPENKPQLYQDFNYTRGQHQLRFGGQFIRIEQNRTFGAFQNAVETLGDSLESGLDNLIRGQLLQFDAAINPQGRFPGETITTPVGPPNFTRYNRYNEWAAYFNDSWRVRPTLTLNLGLRYEYYGVQHNIDPSLDSNFYFGSGSTLQERIRNGRVMLAEDSPVGGLWAKDLNNFAPRLGFAWDVTGDGRTSLRGGYGMAYERNFGNITFNVIQNPPNYAVVSVRAGTDVPSIPVTLDNAGPLAGSGTSIRLPGTSLRHVREDIRNAYAHFWSAAFERELGRGTVASVEFSGSAGRKLYSVENLNRPGSGLAYLNSPSATPSGGTSTRLNGQYTGINSRGNGGFSNYKALIASLDSSNLRDLGLQFTARYTYSVTKDNLSTSFSDSIANTGNLGLTDPFDPRLDYGYAEYDARHRFVGSLSYEVPFFNRLNGLARHLLGGFSLTGIISARSGLPFTIYDCSNGGGACARIVPAGTISFDAPGDPTPDPENPNTFIYLPIPPAVDISGFGANGPFPANMTPRNAFRGPGFYNIDGGLYKRIRFGERYNMQLRLEAFNLLNHANLFIDPNQLDASSFSSIVARRGVFPSGSAERRNVQLAVKFNF